MNDYDELAPTPRDHDPLAERAVLAALIAAPAVAERVWAVISPSMFFEPRHEFLASVLMRMHQDAVAIDPVTIVERLLAAGRIGQFENGAYITTLWGSAYGVDQAPQHAQNVRDAWHHRSLVADVRRMAARTLRPDLDARDLTLELAELADQNVELAKPAQPVGGQTIIDILEANYGAHVSLIPGLLWRRNRYVYTGGEGSGKTELGAELICCSVAGLHPFGGENFKPLTVQVVDAENDGRQTQQRYRRLVPIVEKHCSWAVDWSRLFMENRPEGLTLLRRENRDWLYRVLDTSQPDILAIGSLYKLYRGANVNDESAAGEITAILDDIRSRFDCALIIEAHMGKEKDGTGRRLAAPRGSSAFMGWSEFGHGLLRAEEDPNRKDVHLADLVRYRGDREPGSEWPEQLRRGNYDELPWVPATEIDVERFRFERKTAMRSAVAF